MTITRIRRSYNKPLGETNKKITSLERIMTSSTYKLQSAKKSQGKYDRWKKGLLAFPTALVVTLPADAIAFSLSPSLSRSL